MSDSSNQEYNPYFKPLELRGEMPVDEREKLLSVREYLTFLEHFDRVDEKPQVASMMCEVVIGEYPVESKMEVFAKATELIKDSKEHDANVEVAKILLEMVAAQTDEGLRMRLASIISHQLQEKYFDYDSNDFSTSEYEEFTAKRAAFQLVANDSKLGKGYQLTADAVLNPDAGSILDMYNAMYRRGLDLVVNPRIEEELIKEAGNFEFTGESSGELRFTGNLLMLAPPRIPSLAKIDLYKEKTGKDLPINIVRRTGGKHYGIQIPRRIAEEAELAARQYREGKISKKQAFDLVADKCAQFWDEMNEDQKRDFENADVVEGRFSTERSVREKVEDNKVDIATGEYEDTQAA